MRISTKGRYGLRAALVLAANYGRGPVVSATIAEEESISRKYLHAILTAMKSAGLVRSVRGSAGGFVLARAPSEIRLDEILETLEGPVSLVDCVRDPRFCERADNCTTRRLWKRLSEAMNDVLAGLTLEDLMTPGAIEKAGLSTSTPD